MKLSEYIKIYRKANKMTVQEFADKAGLSKGYISQLENELCKVFRKLSTGIVLLESANDKYAPIEIDVSQDTCFRIIGRYKFKFSIEQED